MDFGLLWGLPLISLYSLSESPYTHTLLHHNYTYTLILFTLIGVGTRGARGAVAPLDLTESLESRSGVK